MCCATLISYFHAQHLVCETTGRPILYKIINLSNTWHNSIHLLWWHGLLTREWYDKAKR